MMITGFAIARLLKVAEFGKFSEALAFASILAVLVDSGMGMLAAKEFAPRGGTLTAANWTRSSLGGCGSVDRLRGGAAGRPVSCCRLRTFAGSLNCLTPGVLLIGTTDFFLLDFQRCATGRRGAPCSRLPRARFLLGLSLLAVTGKHPMASPGPRVHHRGRFYAALGPVPFGPDHARVFGGSGCRGGFFTETLPGIYKMGAILILSVIFTRVDLMIVARFSGRRPGGALWGR